MPKKIIYWVQRYKPSHEAISKEVEILANYFKKKYEVLIFDLHLDGLFNFKFNKKMVSHHFIYYPLTFLFAKALNKRSNLSHIYTSLCDLPYLHVLRKKPIILTATAPCSEKRLKKKIRLLKRLDKIIVENEYDKGLLLKHGISPKSIALIYPPVDLGNFFYSKAKNKKFTILYATSPERTGDFGLRGFNLIASTAKFSDNTVFDAPWRYKSYRKACKIIKESGLSNVLVYHSIIKDMNSKYAHADCTIIPYTKQQIFLKQIPNSAIESLAAGKPILCSSKVEIAKIIGKEKCGVVFEPNEQSLADAIDELKKNYGKYQKNCRKTAEKYFSKASFISKYRRIYEALI